MIIGETQQVRSQAITVVRVCTLVLIISMLLAGVLLVVPYFSYEALVDEVYHTTHCCLDPRAWWPFSYEGFGLFLYQISFYVWYLVVCLFLPIMLGQLFALKSARAFLGRLERKLHGLI